MSIIAIRNGLVATIQAHGKWAASEISTCDLGISELCASMVFLQPARAAISPLTMMAGDNVRQKMRTYSIFGLVLVKDQGDPTKLLENMWVATDDIFDSVNRDDTLSGAACAAYIAEISRPSIDSFLSNGAHDFGYLTFRVDAQIF